MKKRIKIYADSTELFKTVADEMVQVISSTLQSREYATLVLSGGSTPRGLYALLTENPYRNKIDWSRVHLFWGDERNVPPDHPDSNYGMVKRVLLDKVKVPVSNIHRIYGELPAEEAAQLYVQELQSFFKNQLPRFDLTLLGLGEDGHTASLFPQTTALQEKEKLVVAVFVPKFSSWRISLTFPVINASHNIFFLVTGQKKAKVVAQIFKLKHPDTALPASLVNPFQGRLLWFLDEEAASEIIKD